MEFRMSLLSKMALALLLVLPVSQLRASPPDPIRKAISLDEIIVTPARRKQTAQSASRSVSAVSDKKREETVGRSLSEILEDEMGVHIQITNRGAGSPIIRGFAGPQNLIILDGVRFNTGTFRTGPNQYLALINPYAMTRVEVVRGSSSVLYGNGAMGGVLKIFTREPEFLGDGSVTRLAGDFRGRFGSADLSEGATVFGNASWRNVAISLGGAFDLFHTLRAGGGIEVPASDYQVGYWQAKLRAGRNTPWTVSAAYMGTLIRNAGRTDKLGRGEVRRYDNDDHLAYARFTWRGRKSLRSLRATLTYHHLNEFVERANCHTDGGGVVLDKAKCAVMETAEVVKLRHNTDTVNVLGLDLDARFVFGKTLQFLLTTGLEFYYDMVDSNRQDAKEADGFQWKDASRGNFSDGSTYLTFGTYVHGEAVVPFGGKLNGKRPFELVFGGGGRLSLIGASAPDVPGLGEVNYQHMGFVGSAGVQLRFWKLFNIYTTFMQGFRAPNLQETTVLGNTGSKFEVPNPDLLPERSDTIEVGLKFRTFKHLRLRVSYFYSFLQNALDETDATYENQSSIDGTPVVQRVNAIKGSSQGIEAQVELHWKRFRLSTGVTWMEAELEKASGDVAPARRIPPIFGHLSLRYEHPRPRAFAEVFLRFAGQQTDLHPSDLKDLRICETSYHSGVLKKDVGEPCDGTPGYVVLGVRGGWQFHKNWRMNLVLNNVLDASYRVFGSGMPGPGIEGRVSLHGEFP
jgi:hemoglobin/transferrin/lactoferrin receptor protein